MLMMPQPIFDAFASVSQPGVSIYMSPKGKTLDDETARELAGFENITILCGHYEGVDQRVIDNLIDREISIGDYVLTGGELPAMVLIDSVARLLPDVLGNADSALDESIYSGLLEHPQYTKPRRYRGLDVPEVLVSGNHKLINLWKFREALLLTKERRPDMFEEYVKNPERFSKEEAEIVEEISKIKP